MKKTIIVFLAFVCILLNSCNQNSLKKSTSPDISGTYKCSFSLKPSGMNTYSFNGTVTISASSSTMNDGFIETTYQVSAPTPLQDATIYPLSGNEFQFRVPNTVFTHDGKQCFVCLYATLDYSNKSFDTRYCQASFGEYGISGGLYEISNFKLTKN